MSLNQDSLRESKRTKKERTPRHKYLANDVNLESYEWAMEGLRDIQKEYDSAKSEHKREQIVNTVRAAIYRIDLEKSNPKISQDRKDELNRIQTAFRKADRGMHIYHPKPGHVTKTDVTRKYYPKYPDDIRKERDEARKEKSKARSKSIKESDILAFSTQKSGFVKLPNLDWVRISKSGNVTTISDDTAKKAMTKREFVQISKEDKLSKLDLTKMEFKLVFDGGIERSIYPIPVPDVYDVERIEESKSGTNWQGGTGIRIMDGAKAAAFVYNKDKDKPVGTVGFFDIPKLKELKEQQKLAKEDGKTNLTFILGIPLEEVKAETTGRNPTRYRASYNIEYLIKIRKMFGDSKVSFGIFSDKPKSDLPLVATDHKTGHQIVIAPSITVLG